MTLSDTLDAVVLRRLRLALIGVGLVLVALTVLKPYAPALAEALDPPRAVVSGTVFDDRDADGVHDASEPGIEGVSVSDGAGMVETDESGAYTIAVDPGRRVTDLVFISTPVGWSTGRDASATPRFYRSLGPLDDGQQVSADFALVHAPRSRSNAFTFANIADPHANPANPLRSSAAWKAQVSEIVSTSQELAFIQVSGDLTDNATDAEFVNYRSGTSGSDVPVYPAVGNHEYSAGTGYAARIDNYRRHVGPEWYSFGYGERHFVVLDNNGAAPLDEQLDWLRRDLDAHAEGKRVVVLAHQPMNVPFGSPSQYDKYGDLLEKYDTELVLVGHEHSNDPDTDPEFVAGAKHVQTSSSSYTIDHSPRGFRYVRMRGEGFTNPFREYGVDQRLTISAPTPGGDLPLSAPGLVQVSAFDTAEDVRTVRYRLDGSAWHQLDHSGRVTWSAPWRGGAPGLGAHTIDVEATDGAGRTWHRSAEFTVVDKAPVVPVAGADWGQHHGDAAHSGVATDAVDPRGLQLAWSHQTQGSFLTGSPVIAGGVVYAATRDEDGEGHAGIHAVDLATGRSLWTFPTEISVHGSIVVDDGLVYAQDLRSNLYAVDADTGQLTWQRSPVEGPDAATNQRTYGYYGVTVADGKVFWTHQDRYGIGSAGVLAALNPKTGATLWEARLSGSTMSDGTPVVAGGKVFVGNQTADRVLAFDAGTGARLWQSQNLLGGWQDGIPTVAGGLVYIGSNNKLAAKDIRTGADVWSYASPGTSHVPGNATPAAAAVADGTAYMGFPDGTVAALHALTGAPLWTQRLPGVLDAGGVHSSPAVSGDTIYVGSNNGVFYALDRATGAIVWQREVGSWVSAGPAISGNTVVFGAWDGNLYALAAPRSTPAGRSGVLATSPPAPPVRALPEGT